jgi:DNA repair photolyase
MADAATVTQHLEPARSLLRDQGFTDSWFLARYGMNLYRGCQHACAYCDGRAERYRVQGDFERDIVVKTNALGLLERELRRLPEPGFVFLGGGVSDSWQPAEAQHRLARGALEVLLRRGLPVHLLTKSALVLRDRVIVSCSIQSLEEPLRQRFEPGAAPIRARFAVLEAAKARGMVTGLMAMPLLPGLSDQPRAIDALLARAADAGVDFVLWSGLTLRPGVQQRAYLEAVHHHDPHLLPGYAAVYDAERPAGGPDPRYQRRLEERVREALERHGLPDRIPHRVFAGLIPQPIEAALLLEHRQAAWARQGRRVSWLGRSGSMLQRWAHARLRGLGRRRDPQAWRQVEQRFRELVQRGELGTIPELDLRAIPHLEADVRAMPPPRGQAQLSLL